MWTFKKVASSIRRQWYSAKAANAIAASIGRKKYGQREMTRRSVAARKRK